MTVNINYKTISISVIILLVLLFSFHRFRSVTPGQTCDDLNKLSSIADIPQSPSGCAALDSVYKVQIGIGLLTKLELEDAMHKLITTCNFFCSTHALWDILCKKFDSR